MLQVDGADPLDLSELGLEGYITAIQHTPGGAWVGIGRAVVRVTNALKVTKLVEFDERVEGVSLTPKGSGVVLTHRRPRVSAVWLKRGKPASPVVVGRDYGLLQAGNLARRGDTAWVSLGADPSALFGLHRQAGKFRRLSFPLTLPFHHQSVEIADAGSTFLVARPDGVLRYHDWKTGDIVRQRYLGEGLGSLTAGFGSAWGADSYDVVEVPHNELAAMRTRPRLTFYPVTMCKLGIVVASNVDRGYPVASFGNANHATSTRRMWVLSPETLEIRKRFSVAVNRDQWRPGDYSSGAEDSNTIWMDLGVGSVLGRVDVRNAWTYEPRGRSGAN